MLNADTMFMYDSWTQVSWPCSTSLALSGLQRTTTLTASMARPSDPEEVMEAALGVLILALAALASETLQMSATRILFISYFCSVIFEETNTDLPLYQARNEFVILRNRSAGLRSNSNGYFHGKSKETPLKVFQGTANYVK